MGKPTGFLEFSRSLPSKAAVSERVNNYKEFVHRYSDEALNEQSARCMNCGVPFCHSGCPLGNVIPEFNDAVYKKNWEEAYEILSSTNNFPEFTGRICPAPCESACVLGINQPPVAIEEIEKHIIEIAFDKGYVKPIQANIRSGKRVAVVGSGPAGLAAAAQLNYAGHTVTVYERDDQVGGLLRYGIPDFKLEKWVIDRRIEVMQNEGVQFVCNANIGVNLSINDLLREYQAIVLATGSTIPRDLPVPGRSLKGVYFAMQYLKQQNKRNAGRGDTSYANSVESNLIEEAVVAKGKKVIVIGGGDTGSDCVGTANRQGAVSVTQFELLPMPPAERTAQMPWPTYPMILKTTSSHEEGVERKWSIVTKEFLGDENGQLRAVKVVDVQWGSNGFEEVAGSEREIECDLVFLAMGFLHVQKEGLVNELELALDERGNISANKSFQTNMHKVFAAGDARRGQSLVVWAISEGRECAASVDEFLTGKSTILERKDQNVVSFGLV